MTKVEIIKKFLDENEIPYTEQMGGSFFLDSLKFTIFPDSIKAMPKMQASMLAMEIGIMKLDHLVEELDETKEDNIYDFRKEIN